MRTPVVIGISGGTGSGKSTITNAIRSEVEDKITTIPQDSYYKNFGQLSLEEREKINFDHPNTLDNELLIHHIHQLKEGKPIQMPVYDFKTHTRIKETITKNPTKLIIIEGILIFENVELRNMMDIKIFVDTNADIRILRRIQRDISERGRDFQSVVDQYLSTVRPMHIEFVEPSKKYAHVIIPEGGQNKIGIDMIVSKIKHIID